MILVTGANGLVGSYVCRMLLQRNMPFIGLVRETSDLSLLNDIKDSIQLEYGDLRNPQELEPIINKVNTIIHCAAIVSYSPKEKDKIYRVNVEGTENLVNLSLAANIEYFIHLSSVAAIGRSKPSGTINESEKWDNGAWSTRYAETKYQAELEVYRGIAEGLNAVILNPSLILGPGDWEKSSAKLIKYVWDEKPFYTEGTLNYVDLRDVVNIIIKMLDTRLSGSRYILNGGALSYKDFFVLAAEKLNKKAPHIKAGKWMTTAALLLQKIKSLFTNKEPVITKETARLSKNKIYFDNSKIKSELNYTFAPLSDTIDWICEFYLKKNTN
ncbi:NAD-dependent epimerase/dehydratase family protein [Fulvivirga maritima]|uniref:NAD-dependent epimerase/dehydratase family protein n=1 Tax=Fulvivirga maritima TaxID=2904247 RepID=UPI001F42C88C|nr:NAD-dependent epimerase/dehydratase family protein [Fulvivirga maritima]UII27306.1 NAD-dependent epimerase/dehydratase family protein [Fulvivirga maritima]